MRVPFESIYTSVFLLDAFEKLVLIDCATTSRDVDEIIVPALNHAGKQLSDIQAIVLTHRHEDHAGGLERILQRLPDIHVISEPCFLCDKISIIPLPGHTNDSLGVLDTRTGTLISGDGLQGAGVDKYRCNVKNPRAYLETIAYIQRNDSIENILFSHAYEPWNCDYALGRAQVLSCLEMCLNYAPQ